MGKRRYRLTLSHLEAIHDDGHVSRVPWTRGSIDRPNSQTDEAELECDPRLHELWPLPPGTGRTAQRLIHRATCRALRDATYDQLWPCDRFGQDVMVAVAALVFATLLSFLMVPPMATSFLNPAMFEPGVCPGELWLAIASLFGPPVLGGLAAVVWLSLALLRHWRHARVSDVHTHGDEVEFRVADGAVTRVAWRHLVAARRPSHLTFQMPDGELRSFNVHPREWFRWQRFMRCVSIVYRRVDVRENAPRSWYVAGGLFLLGAASVYGTSQGLNKLGENAAHPAAMIGVWLILCTMLGLALLLTNCPAWILRMAHRLFGRLHRRCRAHPPTSPRDLIRLCLGRAIPQQSSSISARGAMDDQPADDSEGLPEPAGPAPRAGHASNVWLHIGILPIIIAAPGIPLAAAGYIHTKNPTGDTIGLCAASVLAGAFIGFVAWALRGRIVTVRWNSAGVTFEIGLAFRKKLSFDWHQVTGCRTYGTAMLVIQTTTGSLRIDALQFTRASARKLREGVRQYIAIEPRAPRPDIIDRSPSWHHDL